LEIDWLSVAISNLPNLLLSIDTGAKNKAVAETGKRHGGQQECDDDL